MKISFVKMSGAGNDFVVVDNRSGIITDPAAFTVRVCERRFGIGADGTLMVESHGTAGFTMKYYNADGSNAGMCGNGGRCIARFAFDAGIVTSERFTFEAFGHIYSAERLQQDRYRLWMKDPSGFRDTHDVAMNERSIKSLYLNTGTDHAVVFLEDNPNLGPMDQLDVTGIGRPMRYHEAYAPKGTNVNFVRVTGDKSIQIRTYERGVEDETLACGTGSIASAVVATMKGKVIGPVAVTVRSGEILEVGFEQNGSGYKNVTLTGSAYETFRGTIEL